jgi:N-acetylglucosaminyldiphosphoundecaprenol N-acetyl-beta-D-mannosaminyltransferase
VIAHTSVDRPKTGRPPYPAASQRVNLLGVGITPTDLQRAAATVEAWIAACRPSYVTVTGVHGVIESQDDEALRAVHNQAGMVVPDGMPLVWWSRLQGHRDVDRVYGPDLMLELCRRSVTGGYRQFLYGGAEGVPGLLAQRLTERFPGLDIVATHSPPFRTPTEEERDAVARWIDESRADIVWVGLSTPKQERWMASMVSRVQSAVFIGVGAAFDFHAGLKPQAPRWMQRSGLEWAFRLATEPRRLWRRYLSNNPRFIYLTCLQAMGLRRYAPAVATDAAIEELK